MFFEQNMQNNLPLPLFASSGQNAQNDDIDLNEIFAEYFINEFDDPLNAYTSSMANYGGLAPDMSVAHPQEIELQQHQQQQQQQYESDSKISAASIDATSSIAPAQAPSVSLPTGGIKTAFHSGIVAAQKAIDEAAAAKESGPATKKQKQDGDMAMALANATPEQIQLLANSLPQALSEQAMLVSQQQQQMLQLASATQAQAVGGAVIAASASSGVNPLGIGRVALPIGVGIRLGGMGGLAASAATVAAQLGVRPPGASGQFALWGPNDGVLTEQAVAERRQRNREHAKRSRVRKKFMLESLQEQVLELQKENERLRMLVQEHIPDNAMQIMADCAAPNPLFVNVPGDTRPETELAASDYSLMKSLSHGQQCFVLSDPKLPDNPIVFASPGFYELTGYTSKEVLGRNCRFLQGPGTDPRAVDLIRKAVATGADATVCLLNYKADGTPFWNQFFIAALRDADNCIVNYVGVQCEVEPEAATAALEEKVNAVLPLPGKDDRIE